jgi:DNA modification methylase
MLKTKPMKVKQEDLQKELEPLLKKIQNNENSLETALKEKIEINNDLNRRIVSFQANKSANGYRWCNYKEGFSAELVSYVMGKVGIKFGRILDPFAGTGAALFAANDLGIDAVGIELLPNSSEIIEIRRLTRLSDTQRLSNALKKYRDSQIWETPGSFWPIKHLQITKGAYPPETEIQLSRYLYEAQDVGDIIQTRILQFAAMCVLESVSYTRKDGQYLRWDYHSGRKIGKKRFEKSKILSFSEAIRTKLTEIAEDIITENNSSNAVGRGLTTILPGSCLRLLPRLQSSSFDGIITSPPYCNRYDYTRTYALELALLKTSEVNLKELRQAMLCCTVENREKNGMSDLFDHQVWEAGNRAFDGQELLQSIISYLEKCREVGKLNNSGIARMVRNYFFEMAIVIADCHRILRPGAPMVLVNDNVRYQGVTIPVDLILSDIARSVGFKIEKIWVLQRGKGNSSQQMGKHGRQEARKCVYVWRLA